MSLIDEILDEFKDINYAYNDSSKFDTLKRMLINAVEAQPEPQWIPCSERLPELDQEVLVYAIGKVDGFGDSVIAMSKRHIFRLFSSSEEGVEVWTSSWPYFSSNYEITHWMPLPDAPKGEEE